MTLGQDQLGSLVLGGEPPGAPTLIPPAPPATSPPSRPALAFYELWDPARTDLLGVVSPWEAVGGLSEFTDEAAGGDTVDLDILRESLYVQGNSRVRALGALGRVLDQYDAPVLVRVGSALPDAAFRLASAIDLPYGRRDILHRTRWRALLFDTQQEVLPQDVDLVQVLPLVALTAVCEHSSIIVPGDVEFPDTPISRFLVPRGRAVWDGLHALADVLGAQIQVTLERSSSSGAWTGKLAIQLSPPPTEQAFFLAGSFNLLPGAQRELATTAAFTRVVPRLTDGSDVSRARFMVNQTDEPGLTFSTMPGDVLGPADLTWTGKYIAFYTTPMPGAAPFHTTQITSDGPGGENWLIQLAAWHASIAFGSWFWFFEDAGCTQPVTYVRHPALEPTLGIRERSESFNLPSEIVENAHAFLGELYDGAGVPAGGGYSAVNTPTLSKNTIARRDVDGDGNDETIVLLGGGSWHAVADAANDGQGLVHTLFAGLDFLKKPLFVRWVGTVVSGQLLIRIVDPGSRAFDKATYPQLLVDAAFTSALEASFANIGNTDLPWTGVKVRVGVQTNNVAGHPTGSISFIVLASDQAGKEIGGSSGTQITISYTADGTIQYAEHAAFVTPPNAGLPAALNLKVKRFGAAPPAGHLASYLLDRVTLQNTANNREIITDVGFRGNLDVRFGPYRPVGSPITIVIAAYAAAAEWYTDALQVKRAESLSDERAPIADSSYCQAVRESVRLWSAEAGERYSFTLTAFDLHYHNPEAHPNPIQVGQLARVLMPELSLDDLFPVVRMQISDFSRGQVACTLARVPARIARKQAQEAQAVQEQLEVFGTALQRLEIRITSIQN